MQIDVLAARQDVDGLQGGVANAAFRHIDDAFEGEIVGRLHHHPEIGQGVADFLAFIESQAAHHLVGHAGGDQPFLEFAGLESGAHQNGHLAQRTPARCRASISSTSQRASSSPSHRPRTTTFSPVAVGPAGAQGLAQPALVVADQAGGGGQNGRRRAVIGLQPDDLGAGKVAFEFQDVADLGAAPGIDRLVVVADAADILVLLGQQAQPQILGDIGVLVFVDQDVAKLPLVVGAARRLGRILEDGQAVQQQIAEVAGVQRPQTILIGAVELRRRGRRQSRRPRRRRPASGARPRSFHR